MSRIYGSPYIKFENIKYEIALKLMQETPFKYEKQNRTIIRGIFK